MKTFLGEMAGTVAAVETSCFTAMQTLSTIRATSPLLNPPLLFLISRAVARVECGLRHMTMHRSCWEHIDSRVVKWWWQMG